MGPRHFFETIGSTQDHALKLAREGARAGTRVVAREQTSGRGRLDHRWTSPRGGLYLSVLARDSVERSTLFPLAVGLEVRRLLIDRYGVRASIKWPNDLVLPGVGKPPRKIGGVLVDRVDRTTSEAVDVVGIGVNVNADRRLYPEELRPRVAWLGEESRTPVDLERLETEVAGAVELAANTVASAGASRRAVGEIRASLYGVGKPILLDGAPVGTMHGIGDDGSLQLDGQGTITEVRAGEVVVVEGP